jgi:hypothetical protein
MSCAPKSKLAVRLAYLFESEGLFQAWVREFLSVARGGRI